MLRSLSFKTMGKKQYEIGNSTPFILSAHYKLVNNHLSPVGKITKLCLPDSQHAWIIQRVTIIKSKHGGFRKQGVIDTKLSFAILHLKEWNISRTILGIIPCGMAVAECSPLAILSG